LNDVKPIVVLKAVKIFHDKGEHVKLQKIDLRGDTTKNFTMNKVCFSKIKFTTTSYKNDGLKFHLVINIIAQDPQQPLKTFILHSLLSPPIFVDSSSQTKKTKRMRKTNGYFSPFDPKYLKKKYTKKELSVSNKGMEYKIQNNFVGLYNYLTAINIKHKTKHPLFLSIEFSKCFRLYFNSQFLQNSIKLEEEIISRLQIIMNSLEITRDHSKSRSSLECPEILEKKLFIFYVEIPNDSNVLQSSRLILDYLEPLKHDLLGYCFNLQSIPSFFLESSSMQLTQTYNVIYPFLFKLKGTHNPLAFDNFKPFMNHIPIKHTMRQDTRLELESDIIEIKEDPNHANLNLDEQKTKEEEQNSSSIKVNSNKPLLFDTLKQSGLDMNTSLDMSTGSSMTWPSIGPNTPLNLPTGMQNFGANSPFSMVGQDFDNSQLYRNMLLQNLPSMLSSNFQNPANFGNPSGLGDRGVMSNYLRSLFLQWSLSYLQEKRITASLPDVMNIIERLLHNYEYQG